MPIKLNGSSSGFTQIDAASVAGNNTLTLPTASGTLMTTGGTNTFTANQVIEVTDNTNAALRITQLGTGNALLVEDSTNPDSSPFVVDASGNVGVGTTSPAAKFVIEGGSSSDQMRMGTGSNYYKIGRESVSTGFLNFYGTQTGANGYVFGGVDGERMRIDSSGNVLIGSASTPSGSGANLQVSNSTAARLWLTCPAARNFYLESSTGNALQFVDGTAGAERMRIDSSGNVGIGTTSPSYPLTVQSSNPEMATLTRNVNVSVSGAAGVNFNLGALVGTTPTFGASIQGVLEDANNGYMALRTRGASGITERMRIDAYGNVIVGGTAAVYGASGRGVVTINGSSSALLGFTAGGVDKGFVFHDGTNLVVSNTVAANLILQTGNTERMRVDSSGNVGIGTSSPGQKLDVSGNIRSTGADANVLANATTGSAALAAISNARYWRWITSNGDSALRLNDETAGVERMRIDFNGNVLVGATSAITGTNTLQVVNAATDSTQIRVRNSGATAGQHWRYGTDSVNTIYIINHNSAGVYINNGGTSWSGLSDERAKDIIEPISDAASKVASLRAVIGKYKTDEDGVRRSFLIAQDVQAVLPEAVSIANQETGYLGLSYTDTIPLLTAALQEALAKINVLEARLAALENA